MGDRAIKCRFPNTTLKAANLVPVSKNVGILRDAIDDDVEYLLYQFRSGSSHGFRDFDDLWNRLHFNLVHFASVKRESRGAFMNAFYSSVLDWFRSPSPIMKCGVIFTLYFLYISQPTVWGKIRIRVSTETWKMLFDFYTDCIYNDTNVQAALIFDKLRKEETFLFVQKEKIDTHLVQEKIELEKAIVMLDRLQELKMSRIKNESVDLCMNPSLSEYEAVGQSYQLAKTDTFYTPQAALATQRNHKEKYNVTEKRPSFLRKGLLGSTLAQQNETLTVKRIQQTNQQMWNSKRRKLELQSQEK